MPFQAFVGQFLLRHGTVQHPPDWPVHASGDWTLCAHPTTPVAQLFHSNGHEIGWLVGEAMQGGRLIRRDFRLEGITEEEVERALFGLGGPWVAIVLGPGPPRLYGDAFGQLPVVYSPVTEAVAASPSLLPAHPDTEEDGRLVALMDIPKADRFYPFGLTPRRNVRRLLPSHRLDLNTWRDERIWPRVIPHVGMSVSEAGAIVDPVLRESLQALASAYPLQMSLTAGYDSRMILACARDRLNELLCVTNNSHPKTAALDIAAARFFAERYALDLVVRQPRAATESERAAWLQQTGATGAGGAFQHLALTNAYGTERARLSGQGGEVLRGYFYAGRAARPASSDYSGRDLVSLLKLPADDALIRHADAWLASAPACSGAQLLDLLYLEQRMGAWAGPLRLGGTSAHRVFWPIAHRAVLDVMLRLPEQAKRDSAVHAWVIEQAWPELMDIPVNEWFGRHRLRHPIPWRTVRARLRRLLNGLR